MKLHQAVVLETNRVQKYFLPHNQEGSRERALPGQFVHESNESDMVAGFITEVGEYGFVICLFEAIAYEKLPAAAMPVSGEISKDEMIDELHEALEKNPGMKPYWVRAINGETVQ